MPTQLERDKVQDGVAWLNQVYPDWRSKVNPDELRTISCSKCVLGQIGHALNIGGFFEYICAHSMSLETAQDLGFDTSDNTTYNGLDQAWHEVLSA